MADKTTPCAGCGEQTCYKSNDAEPCWGQLEPTEMKDIEGRGFVDAQFFHTCEGHRGDEYVPE